VADAHRAKGIEAPARQQGVCLNGLHQWVVNAAAVWHLVGPTRKAAKSTAIEVRIDRLANAHVVPERLGLNTNSLRLLVVFTVVLLMALVPLAAVLAQ